MSDDRRTDADANSVDAPNRAPDAVAKRYEKPALTQYGPLSKITQGASGSTGESGNFTMRMCL